MARFTVRESPPLRGEVRIGTSKNAVLPIMAAALLTKEEVRIKSPPQLSDVHTLLEVLRDCGCETETQEGQLLLRAGTIGSPGGYECMRRMRASVLVMGPLLAREGQAQVTLPGGCAIGQRPIDQHLKGMAALGAEISMEHGGVLLRGRLHGATIYLDMPSVGATENLMMAACLADGTTRIENAAKEPEIVDLAMCLCEMGGHVSGAGTSTLTIEGVKNMHGTQYTPITDRIEAGTMACAAALTGGDLLLTGARSDHLRALLFKLTEAGVHAADTPEGLRVRGRAQHPMEIRTMAYPGFPTDLQAPMMVLCCQTPGTSVFLETIFENRYMHAAELARMGARIRVEDRVAIVEGVKALTGAQVRATDLRAGASLLLAGLCAQGETLVEDDGGHIDRGYERIEEKLRAVGADINRVREKAPGYSEF